MDPIRFTIYGQAQSKANSRRIVTIKGRPSSIKSQAAREFEHTALLQIPPQARVRLQGKVAVRLVMFYPTERPDLDESIVLDAMQDRWMTRRFRDGHRERVLVQGGVYCNDRQVRAKVVLHGIDRSNPRIEVEVRSIEPTEDLFSNLAYALPTLVEQVVR